MYINQEIGKRGEKKAEEYLKKSGYKILEKNFYSYFGELDIVALEEKTIIFIEVKTRSSLEYGLPSEAVTKLKIKHMYKTAEYYLYKRNLYGMDVRFDVIEIYIKNNKTQINHLKQVI